MSTRNYVVVEYGLYILPEEIKKSENDEREDFEIADDTGMSYYDDADGEIYPLSVDVIPSYSYVEDQFFFAHLSKYPSLFEKKYENVDEAICELKNNYSEYLVDNFDYLNRFVCYMGTMYG